MKVLMFVNISILSEEEVLTGSWLRVLASAISRCDCIEFGFVSFSNDKTKTVTRGNLIIYNIKKDNSLISKIKKRTFQEKSRNNYINLYLKIINDFQPDIIHIHGSENNFSLIQDIVKIPIVISIQGLQNCIYNKVFSGLPLQKVFRNFALLNFVLFRGLRIEKHKRKQAIQEKKSLRKAKHIIGRTHFDRRVIKILAPKARYYFCPEILRTSFYANRWSPNNNKELTLFSILNGTIYKGLETLMLALNELRKQSIEVKWNIAGLDSNNKTIKLFSRSISGFKPDNIIFLGLISAEKIIKTMLESDIYVQVSHIENSPNALSEALLVGMPCIASFAGGTSTFINENVDGLLYQDGDYLALAGAILELKNNPEKAKETGKLARINALKRHDKEKILNTLANLYFDIKKDDKSNICHRLNSKGSNKKN